MPAMPRPKKAQKISDKVMKKSRSEQTAPEKGRKVDGENQFDRNVRTMIKR